MSEALAHDTSLITEAAEDNIAISKAGEEELQDDNPSNPKEPGYGKVIVAEEIQKGHVSWRAFKIFLVNLGGNHPFLFWLASVGGYFMVDVIDTVQIWWLGFWARQYNEHSSSDVHVPL